MKANFKRNKSFFTALCLMLCLVFSVSLLTACTPEAQAKSAVNALYNKDGTDIAENLTAKDDGRFEAATQAVEKLTDDEQKKELTGKIETAQKMVDVQAKAKGLYKETDGKTLMADNAKQDILDTIKKEIKALNDAGMTGFAERETAAIADADGYLACVKKLNTLYSDGTRKQITDAATTKGCDEVKALADKIGNADIKKQATDLVEKAKKDVAARNEQVVAAGGTVDAASGAVTAWAPAVTESYSGSSGGGSDYSGGSDSYSSGSGYSSGNYSYDSGSYDYSSDYSSGGSDYSSSGDSGVSSGYIDSEGGGGNTWETGGTFDWPEGW